MLQKIRDRSTGWFSWIVIGAVVIVFALFGLSHYFTEGARDTAVATVDSEAISPEQLASVYQLLREESVVDKTYQSTQSFERLLKETALQRLIHHTALVVAAKRAGFVTSPAIQRAILVNFPLFQKDGVFSPEKFQQFLTQNPMAPWIVRALEEDQLLQQVQNGMMATEFVLPQERDQLLRWQRERRTVAYLTIDAQRMSDETIVISEQEKKAFYKEHKKLFQVPRQVKFSYVILSPDALAKNIHPSDKELQDYFSSHATDYPGKTFAQVKDAVQVALIHERAQSAFDANVDQFANISYAQADSLTPVAKALGLSIATSDYVSRKGQSSGIASHPDVLQAVFSQDVLVNKNNSAVITLNSETQVVLHVEAIKPAHSKPYAEVAKTIQEELMILAKRKRALALAEKISKELTEKNTLQALANRYELSFHAATEMTRDQKEVPPAILAAAFGMTNSSVVPVDENKTAVVQVSAIQPGNLPDEASQKAFAKDVANELGNLEYGLYVDQVIKTAQTTIHKE